MFQCGCNVINIIASGGARVSPKAVIVLEKISGGVSCNGSALVDVLNDVFDNFTGFWSLNETGSGVPGEYLDKSRKQYHGTGGAEVPTTSTGIGCLPCQVLEEQSTGSGQYIDLPPDDIETNFAFSMWVNMSKKYAQRTFYSRGNPYVFQLGYSFLNHIVATLKTDLGIFECYSDRLELDKNYHIACSYNGQVLNLHVNGVLVDSLIVNGAIQANTSSSHFGKLDTAGFPDCKLQEARLWSEEKSEDWFLAERENFCGSLYTISELQTVTST